MVEFCDVMERCLELTDHWLDAFCVFQMKGQMCNIQSACLAAYLSAPTEHAWAQLGRLIGYLHKTVGYDADDSAWCDFI